MPRAWVAILLGLAVGACGREPARTGATAPAASAAPEAAQSSPVAPSPAPSPIAVRIVLEAKDASPSPLAREWLEQLQAVLAANPTQFRVVNTAQEADLSVRIERVVVPQDSPGHQVMTLWLTVGQEPTQFTLDYTGGPAAMAGRLARFLVAHVQKARAGPVSKPSAPARR